MDTNLNFRYQMTCRDWCINTFGRPVALSHRERVIRFVEEALELGQACGMSEEDMIKLITQVYSKPKGEFDQEVGGCIVTLALLCSAYDTSMAACGVIELKRCINNSDAIRAKRASKLLNDDSVEIEVNHGTAD